MGLGLGLRTIEGLLEIVHQVLDIFKPEAIEQVVRAAKLLVLLAQKASRHGVSSPARTPIEELGLEIDNRARRVCDELAQNPTHAAAAAQLAGIIKVCESLFDDGRAAVMTRRLVNMQRAGAPA